MKKLRQSLQEVFDLKFRYGLSSYLLWNKKKGEYFVSTYFIPEILRVYELIKFFK